MAQLTLLCVAIVAAHAISPFSFNSQPTSVYVGKGEKFTLYCDTSNGVNVKYTWYKEASVPSKGMSSVYSSQENLSSGLLIVTSAEKGNTGFYQCMAKGDTGTIYSDVAYVNVEFFDTISATTTSVTVSTPKAAVRTVLECKVESTGANPAAAVTWYKDDSPVSNAKMFVVHTETDLEIDSIDSLSVKVNSLVLFNIDKEMAGKYVCKARVSSNRLAVTEQTVATHTVTVSKEFDSDIQYSSNILASGTSGSPGDTVTVYCAMAGNKLGINPSYKWYAVNGENVQITDGVNDNGRSLTLSGITASHSYACKACVTTTCASKAVTVSVSAAVDSITFSLAPTSYYLYEDGSSEGPLTITCVTSQGEGNWMKDGKSVSLPITSPKASDSGYYQCYAANSNNWIQKTTQVVVTEKATLSLSAPSEIDSTTSNTIDCTTSGYPAPVMVVYKTSNGKTEALNNCYNGDSDSMGCVRKDGDKYFVTIKSDDITATGIYKCVATQMYSSAGGNVKKVVAENEADVAVVKDVSITSFEGPSSLTYGDSVSYTCVVAGGRAPYKVAMQMGGSPVFVWNKDGQNVGEGSCSGDTTKTCVAKVPSVGYSHEGQFNCSGWNTAKNSTMKSATKAMDLTVVRPVTVDMTGNRFMVNAENLVLTCTHHEKPFSFDESKVFWTFNGATVVPTVSTTNVVAAEYRAETVASFYTMTSNNAGVYKCSSEGVLSAGTTVFVDSVVAPSTPSLKLPDGYVGVPLNMTCTATGYPPPDITWSIYSDKQVENVTYVTKEEKKTTSIMTWTPDQAVEMMITCYATVKNMTVDGQGKLIITIQAETQQSTLESSEVAAIIAASIIAGIILFICLIFCIICCCNIRRERKHDGNKEGGTIAKEPGAPSSWERGCLAAYIACCPCCIKKADRPIEQEKPSIFSGVNIPTLSLPKFGATFGRGDDTVDIKESPLNKGIGQIRRSFKASVKRLSHRNKIRDSPDLSANRKSSFRKSSLKKSLNKRPSSLKKKPITVKKSPSSIKKSPSRGPSLRQRASALRRIKSNPQDDENPVVVKIAGTTDNIRRSFREKEDEIRKSFREKEDSIRRSFRDKSPFIRFQEPGPSETKKGKGKKSPR